MIRGREDVEKLLAILREHVPGFEHCQLKAVAPLLGVRETRRIVADSIMTVRGPLRGQGTSRISWGSVCMAGTCPIPRIRTVQPLCQRQCPPWLSLQTVKKGLSTPVPYGIMVPRPIRNLICPGRAVSVERQVLGTVRVMAPCMAMGEARRSCGSSGGRRPRLLSSGRPTASPTTPPSRCHRRRECIAQNLASCGPIVRITREYGANAERASRRHLSLGVRTPSPPRLAVLGGDD